MSSSDCASTFPVRDFPSYKLLCSPSRSMLFGSVVASLSIDMSETERVALWFSREPGCRLIREDGCLERLGCGDGENIFVEDYVSNGEQHHDVDKTLTDKRVNKRQL